MTHSLLTEVCSRKPESGQSPKGGGLRSLLRSHVSATFHMLMNWFQEIQETEFDSHPFPIPPFALYPRVWHALGNTLSVGTSIKQLPKHSCLTKIRDGHAPNISVGILQMMGCHTQETPQTLFLDPLPHPVPHPLAVCEKAIACGRPPFKWQMTETARFCANIYQLFAQPLFRVSFLRRGTPQNKGPPPGAQTPEDLGRESLGREMGICSAASKRGPTQECHKS